MSKALVTGGLAVAALGVGVWAALTASAVDTTALEQNHRELASRLSALEERETELESVADDLRQRLARSEEATGGLRAQVSVLEGQMATGGGVGAAVPGAGPSGASDTADGTEKTGKDFDPRDPALREEFDTLIAKFFEGGASAEEQERFWALAKNPEFLTALLDDLEEAVEGAPGDTGARMDLATGYVVKLFTVPAGPEMGVWATKAEGQWQEVLKVDDSHWEARFSLATSWSRYPEFLNKTPDAIREFKKLRDVQEKQTPEAQHAQTYVQLALLHTRQNNKDAAREALKAGLERHPDDADLKKTLESMK